MLASAVLLFAAMKPIALVIAMTLASGCIIAGRPVRRQQAYVVRERPACHPSQYWDGSTCRHKGNGWGARKHDGR